MDVKGQFSRSSGHGAQESGQRPENVQGRARVRSRLGQGLAAALGWLGEPKAGHHFLARSAAGDAACGRASGGSPRKKCAPCGPAEKTERPAKPAEKEAEPANRPASKEEKPAAKDEKPREKPRKNFLRRHPLMAGAGLIALLVAGAAAYVYWDNASHFESTDDAFIAARQFAIAPKVAGYVTAVPVTDNQHVNKGDVIARIDQRDYLTALAQAQAQVAGAEAGIHNVDTQIATQDAQISAAQAQVAQAQANAELAQVTWGRDKPLVKQGWATAQQGTTDVQNLKAQQATVDSAQAALKVAQRQIDTLRAQRTSQEATLAQAKAQLDQANLNLSYTTDHRRPAGPGGQPFGRGWPVCPGRHESGDVGARRDLGGGEL